MTKSRSGSLIKSLASLPEKERLKVLSALTPLETRAILKELDDLYRQDPWLWLCEEVFTQDEATQRRLPWPRDKEYLRDLVEILTKERLVAIPKSRRMMVSWLVAALAVWEARYFPHNAIFIQSETEQKAAFIVDQRCRFIEDNLREEGLRRPYRAIRTHLGAVGKMIYDETGSYIWAIPQGDSVIRTYTFSRLIMDESDFQPEGHAALAAALPIAETGKNAKIVLVTTSAGPSGVVAEICRGAGFVKWNG